MATGNEHIQTDWQKHLPDGWSAASVSSITVDVIGGDWGKSPDDAPDEWRHVRVIRGTEYRNWAEEKGRTAALRAIKPQSLERRRLELGDLIVEVSGGGPDQPVGRVLLVDGETLQRSDLPLVCSNFCRRLRLFPVIDAAFVHRALEHLYARGEFNRFQNQTTNIRNLQYPDFSSGTFIPIPPLAEQRRIVAAVEGLLERVQAARGRLEKVPAILKRFRQSVLAAACSGRLTEVWREGNRNSTTASDSVALIEIERSSSQKRSQRREHGNEEWVPVDARELPPEWSWTRLRNVLDYHRTAAYGVLQPGPEVPDGIPMVRVCDVENGRVSVKQLKRIAPSIAQQYVRTTLNGGELLVSLVGTIGRAAAAT